MTLPTAIMGCSQVVGSTNEYPAYVLAVVTIGSLPAALYCTRHSKLFPLLLRDGKEEKVAVFTMENSEQLRKDKEEVSDTDEFHFVAGVNYDNVFPILHKNPQPQFVILDVPSIPTVLRIMRIIGTLFKDYCNYVQSDSQLTLYFMSKRRKPYGLSLDCNNSLVHAVDVYGKDIVLSDSKIEFKLTYDRINDLIPFYFVMAGESRWILPTGYDEDTGRNNDGLNLEDILFPLTSLANHMQALWNTAGGKEITELLAIDDKVIVQASFNEKTFSITDKYVMEVKGLFSYFAGNKYLKEIFYRDRQFRSVDGTPLADVNDVYVHAGGARLLDVKFVAMQYISFERIGKLLDSQEHQFQALVPRGIIARVQFVYKKMFVFPTRYTRGETFDGTFSITSAYILTTSRKDEKIVAMNCFSPFASFFPLDGFLFHNSISGKPLAVMLDVYKTKSMDVPPKTIPESEDHRHVVVDTIGVEWSDWRIEIELP